jgi:AcrR family transcriptional regulator
MLARLEVEFSQHGYASTSVRDILKAAQVTQPTLYYTFAVKASLFRRMIEKHYGDSQLQLEQTVEFNSAVDDRLLAFAVTLHRPSRMQSSICS